MLLFKQTAPYTSHAAEGVRWSGFGTVFTFSAVRRFHNLQSSWRSKLAQVALNVHYNMPDVIQPVSTSDKPKLNRVVSIG